MKKLIMFLILLCSFGFAFTTWNGSEGIYQIDTGLDVGTETAGYWFTYNDNADKGVSTIEWPVPTGNEHSESAMDPAIDYCAGVCGMYVLDAGLLTYNPFVGIGFNVGGEDDSKTPAPVDATAMGGICIGYSVDTDATLELGLGDAVDATLAFDSPAVKLPKTTGAVKRFTWASFKQAGWGKNNGGETITGDEAATKLVSVKMKIQSKSGVVGNFNIMSVGAYDGNCTVNTSLIVPKTLRNSVKI